MVIGKIEQLTTAPKEKSYNETEEESLKLMVLIARVHGHVEGIADSVKWATKEHIEELLREVARELGEIQTLERSNRLDFSKT